MLRRNKKKRATENLLPNYAKHIYVDRSFIFGFLFLVFCVALNFAVLESKEEKKESLKRCLKDIQFYYEEESFVVT